MLDVRFRKEDRRGDCPWQRMLYIVLTIVNGG